MFKFECKCNTHTQHLVFFKCVCMITNNPHNVRNRLSGDQLISQGCVVNFEQDIVEIVRELSRTIQDLPLVVISGVASRFLIMWGDILFRHRVGRQSI